MSERKALIARYKKLLRGFIDRRPSGLRGRIAVELGKHKSFISQITNPSYRVPIPSGDLDTIFRVCHISEAEQEKFLAIYRAAHPKSGNEPRREAKTPPREIKITLPCFRDPTLAKDVESLIEEFAKRTIRLAQTKGQNARRDKKGKP